MKPDAVAVEKELKACATQPISVKSKKKMEDKKFYTLLVYSENIAGILNQITAVFTRRQGEYREP